MVGIGKIVLYVVLGFIGLLIFAKFPMLAFILLIVWLVIYLLANLIKASKPKPREFGRFR